MTEGKVREVHPGIFVVHLPLPMKPTIVNVTVLHSKGHWALVDTGINTEDSVAALEAALEMIGARFADIEILISTHHHPDHYGASATLRERMPALVYLNALELEASTHYGPGKRSGDTIRYFHQHGIPLRRFAHVPSPAEHWSTLYAPTQPDRLIDDGDVIQVGDFDIEIVGTPGHTPGHCVLYLRREKVMIVGDHLLPKITPHVGAFPGGPENPLADFIDSQKKVQRYEVDLVLPAHGGVFRDHRHRADQIIQHHHYRMQEMLDIVKREPRTAYNVASQAWGFGIDASLTVQFPATFEAIAHLEYMRSLGMVTRDEGELILYRAAA